MESSSHLLFLVGTLSFQLAPEKQFLSYIWSAKLLRMIPVTKSYIPDKKYYYSLLDGVFDRGWLTNRGVLVKQLEDSVKEELGLIETDVLCVSNGTTPIQIALKLLGDQGEVITTPFSYVATTSAIVWENCTPVFVDIDPNKLTIDESKIEEAITEKTTCILATHVFGNACNIEEIERIAQKHGLKVIYDAAHCFGVQYKGKSIFEYGDVSICSFHATKLFHSGEGGAVFCKDKELFNKFYLSHNFGHSGPFVFDGVGINGKMSEIHGALGLSVLKDFKSIMQKRIDLVELYKTKLDSSKISYMELREGIDWNGAYLPVVFSSEEELLSIEKLLNSKDIFPRRYFYPSLDSLPYVDARSGSTLNSVSIASRVLCLPLYYTLLEEEVEKVCELINQNVR